MNNFRITNLARNRNIAVFPEIEMVDYKNSITGFSELSLCAPSAASIPTLSVVRQIWTTDYDFHLVLQVLFVSLGKRNNVVLQNVTKRHRETAGADLGFSPREG